MDGQEITQERNRDKVKRKVRSFLGPAGIFFKGFVEHPVMVGSIIPSSSFTIKKMLEPVDWARCKLFVEYGPGVGTFCKPVLERLPRDGMLIVIDTNPLFIDYLKHSIGDSRFVAVHGSAEDVEEIVKAHGHEKADYVLSGLPFSTLPEGVGDTIADATYRVIKPGGAFLTYQFNRAATNYTKQYFDSTDIGFELFNILPAKLAWGWKDEEA